jgi:hypothetical protein
MDLNLEKKKGKYHLEAPFVILIVLAVISLVSRIYLMLK